MADGSVIIKVEMETGGVQAGVDDIRAGCGRAAAAAERTGKAVTRAMADGTRSMEACGEGAKRAGALVHESCGKVRDGMSAVVVQNGAATDALERMRASLSAVKLSLATAFAPVVTAAAPLLIKLSELVAKAADYVARFFAVLRGKSTYKKAVAAQDAITDSVAGTGKAAKEAARNLSGLDELNIWKEDRTGSGGGGYGGSGGGSGGVDEEDVEVGEVSDFVVRLRDILFQWDDLNPELIAEKILTGLCAAAGGIIGYTLGGPLGGMVGLTLGALLGVKLSQLTFNGDGKLDKTEITKMILTALGGLIGGVLGFVIGGPLGAAIGFTVGAGIGVALSNAEIKEGVSVADWVKEKVVGLVQKAVDAYHAVVEFAAGVKNNAKEWWANVKTWWGEKADSVKEFATSVANNAAAWWSNVQTWWSGKVGSVKEFATSVANNAATWWSNVQTWWKGKVGAVQSFKTAVTNSAATWWSNVQTWWKGKVGSVQSFKTAVTNSASTWWSNVKTWWKGKVGSVQSFKTAVTNSASTWWSNVKKWWSGKVGSVKSFTTSVTNGAKNWWSYVKIWWNQKVGAVKSFTTSVVNSASTWWSSVKEWWKNKSKDGVTFKAKVTSFVDAIKDKTITLSAKISNIVGNARDKFLSWLGLATGGIYKNGKWEPIAGYASGGSPRSARLFYANENGMPELVGRIGSSTAVMNNGQIVASVAAGVYQAVAAAMGQMGGWFRAMSARLGDIPPAIEMLSAMPTRIPQPVMATGTVLPPKAVYVDGPVRGLADAVEDLRSALDRQGPDRSGTGREPTYNVNLNVDGQTLCRIVLREGRSMVSRGGTNPFMELGG